MLFLHKSIGRAAEATTAEVHQSSIRIGIGTDS